MAHSIKAKVQPPGSRKAGAQPGNQNALKHGFYSRAYKGMEEADLSNLSEGLVDEIDLMRVIMGRVFILANKSEDANLEVWSNLMGSMGLASTRLAGLLKTQKVITGGGGGDIATALSEALKDITRDLA